MKILWGFAISLVAVLATMGILLGAEIDGRYYNLVVDGTLTVGGVTWSADNVTVSVNDMEIDNVTIGLNTRAPAGYFTYLYALTGEFGTATIASLTAVSPATFGSASFSGAVTLGGVARTTWPEGGTGTVDSLDNTYMDNTVIGDNVASRGKFTTLENTGKHTSSGGTDFPDSAEARFGTDNDFSISFDPANFRLVFIGKAGAALTDNDAIFTFRAGTTSALGDGQTVVAFEDNTTSKLWKLTKEGNTEQTGTAKATQFTTDCAQADNNCYINFAVDGYPSTPTLGDTVYHATDGLRSWNGAAWDPPASSWTVLSDKPIQDPGASPTVDASGEMGIDNTDGQFVYHDGAAARTLTWRKSEKITIYNYAAAHDNAVSWPAEDNVTLTSMTCRTQGTDNVTATVYRGDTSAANWVTTGLSVAATSTPGTDASASDGAAVRGAWFKLSLSSIVGTPTVLNCGIEYVSTRQ